MAVGKKVETRGHVTGFKEEISAALDGSDDAFFTWFNAAKDANEAFVRGHWDFLHHIALPAMPHLTTPETKSALEIGHGGGRILSAASRHFLKVHGVDIHNCNDRVAEELRRRGVENFDLFQSDGKTIPIDDASMDFVYSFIVLQHVEKFAVLESYFTEAHRTLKPGGLAVLYFGRWCRFSANRASKIRYWLDRFLERLALRDGFREFPAKVNETNLLVSLPKASQLARRLGFEILGTLVSRKKIPDGAHLCGGQHGLVLRKR